MSNFTFEIRLENGHRLKEYHHDNARYIEGRKNSNYVLYFRNNTGRRVLVVPSVDGLSVMDGKPASAQSSGYVVPAWGDVSIPGWYLDSNKVAKFKFRPQGDKDDATYVEALRADGVDVDAGNQGVIGALVFGEQYEYTPVYRGYGTGYGSGIRGMAGSSEEFAGRPRGITISAGAMGGFNSASQPSATMGLVQNGPTSDASYSLSASVNTFVADSYVGAVPTAAAPEQPLGTGMGEDHTFKTTTTAFKRSTIPHHVHTIFYDTLAGLRRKGIPVDVVKQPQAFPGSPDIGCYIPSTRKV